MDVITNKEVNVYLDNEKGTLCLTGMLVGTMVFLYDSQGELKEKHRFALPSLTLEISRKGTYVLVMSHPNCQPEVRRIIYSGNIKKPICSLGNIPAVLITTNYNLVSEY